MPRPGREPRRRAADGGAPRDASPACADPELQRIVHSIRAELGFPMALLSVVEKRAQRCRAQAGWPDGCRMLDRAIASFCGRVFATGRTLEVPNVTASAETPQDLIRDYGIRSYVGLPLTVCGHVLGSLCAIDTQPRQVTPHEHRRLTQLAARAAARVAEIAPDSLRSEHLIAHAVHPAFLEIRNLLNVLLGDISLLGLALGDVKTVLDLVRHADPALSADVRDDAFRALRDAVITNQDLHLTHERLETIGMKLTRYLLALEASLMPGADPLTVAEAVALAARLARHVTRTIGGVRWQQSSRDATVAGTRMTTVAALAAALRLIAEGLAPGARSGIDGTVALGRGVVAVTLRAPEANAEVYRTAGAALGAYAQSGIGLSVSAGAGHVSLTWSRPLAPPLA